jgi:putative ABC transport system substrate-binding protein
MELLKEIAPEVRRVAVLREPGAAGIGQWAIIQSVAQSMGVELKSINSTNAAAMERSVAAFANSPNGGLIVLVSASGLLHRDLIISLAARHRLPTAYAYRVFVVNGGLFTTAPIFPVSIGAPPATSIAFSKARSQVTYRCSRRPSMTS